jgi:hypothetical protein
MRIEIKKKKLLEENKIGKYMQKYLKNKKKKPDWII